MENLVNAKSETANTPAVNAQSNLFEAVRGVSAAGDAHGAVVGINTNNSQSAGPGVFGKSKGTGVWGESETWHAVAGMSNSTTGGAGVYGKSKGSGVIGESETWHAVAGISSSTTGGAGVYGKSKGPGVLGESETWHGSAGISQSTTGGAGIYGKGKPAGLFDGNVVINGILLLNGADILQIVKSLSNEVAALRAEVRNNSGGTPTTPPTTPPTIQVSIEPTQLKVTGWKFLPSGQISVKVQSASGEPQMHEAGNADASGKFVYAFSTMAIASRTKLTISAHDGRNDPSDFSGLLYSNKVDITVP